MKSNVAELRKKSAPELIAEQTNLLREQFKLKLQKASGNLKRNHLLRKVRRDIARINAILTELQIERTV